MSILKKKFKCLECDLQFISGNDLSRHVTKVHGYSTYTEYKIKHKLIKTENDLIKEGAVSCIICGKYAHDLTSHIIRGHKISVDEYKIKYSKTIRSVKYLLEQSERIKGNKNPAYDHGGKFSPFSKKFIHADKIDRDSLILQVKETIKKNHKNSCTLEYWLSKGYTESEAKHKRSERQRTFTLEKCIQKHGKEKGTKIWVERQEKWLKKLNKSFAGRFSKISQKLFWEIYSKLKDKDSIYFAELDENKNPDYSGKNHEFKIKLKHRMVLPDFYDEKTKKIIEFDGTYWHGEHIIRNSNKEREENRDKFLLSEGYNVLHIKEEDYRQNPDNVVKICLEFLNV